MASVKRNLVEDAQVLQETKSKAKLTPPDMYRVVLLNDDYTPQEFVVWILIKVFYKSNVESNKIMLDAHTHGKSTIGVYTFDIARTKVMQVKEIAEKNEHPLECILEVESTSDQ